MVATIVLFSKQGYQFQKKKTGAQLLRLYILRHAKSSWALPGKSDYDRGLNERGDNDLLKIAQHMNEKNYKPDQVYSSPSTRTRLTIDGIVARFRDFSPAIEYVDNLYSGSLENYMDCLTSHSDKNQSLMIVGHNPTCDSLAAHLIGDGETQAMETIAYKFPTGALAVIDIDKDNWADISEGSGYLSDFALPRKL